jgi:hypothetical protein
LTYSRIFDRCAGNKKKWRKAKASDCSEALDVSSRSFRLFDSGEGIPLTLSRNFDRPLGSPTCDCIVNMAGRDCTFIALRFIEVFAWYHRAKVVARGRAPNTQRFHKKVRLYTVRPGVIPAFHRKGFL